MAIGKSMGKDHCGFCGSVGELKSDDVLIDGRRDETVPACSACYENLVVWLTLPPNFAKIKRVK